MIRHLTIATALLGALTLAGSAVAGPNLPKLYSVSHGLAVTQLELQHQKNGKWYRTIRYFRGEPHRFRIRVTNFYANRKPDTRCATAVFLPVPIPIKTCSQAAYRRQGIHIHDIALRMRLPGAQWNHDPKQMGIHKVRSLASREDSRRNLVVSETLAPERSRLIDVEFTWGGPTTAVTKARPLELSASHRETAYEPPAAVARLHPNR